MGCRQMECWWAVNCGPGLASWKVSASRCLPAAGHVHRRGRTQSSRLEPRRKGVSPISVLAPSINKLNIVPACKGEIFQYLKQSNEGWISSWEIIGIIRFNFVGKCRNIQISNSYVSSDKLCFSWNVFISSKFSLKSQICL